MSRPLRILVVLLGLIGLIPAIALGQGMVMPAGTVEGLHRSLITILTPSGGGEPILLEAAVTRPDRPGRHPLLLLSHGTPRDPADRIKTHANGNAPVAVAFAQRGWIVVSLVRQGYGRSGGVYRELSGPCANPDYRIAARASASDLLEALKVLVRREDVDPTRIILAGISAGGFASLAAAGAQPPGVVAVLNFAGGRGSSAPDTVCRSDRLVEAFEEMGARVKVPTLWVYAANDRFFSPELARRFQAGFAGAGGKAELVMLDAFGEDGHRLFSSQGVPLWRDPVDRFLRTHGLPTWAAPVRPTLAEFPRPSGLSASGRTEFDRYLASIGFEKALAIGGNGSFVWRSGYRTPEEAAEAALAACTATTTGCRVYAVNNRVMR